MIPVRDANARLCEIGATLRAGDFKHTVVLMTRDSIQIYVGAIAKRYGDWLLLWTEHHGYQLEHQDEIIAFQLLPIDRFPRLDRKVLPSLLLSGGLSFEELPVAEKL